jgi:hypothetical protein
MPRRIQQRRTRGWRKPSGAVAVHRSTRWGNLHDWQLLGRAEAVDRDRSDLYAGRLSFTVDDVRRELAGRDLMCWCPTGEPCHSDVLLEIANASR